MSYRRAGAVGRRIAATPIGRASVSNAPAPCSVKRLRWAIVICATTIGATAIANAHTTPEPLPYKPTETINRYPIPATTEATTP